jgi:hypothetical protein
MPIIELEILNNRAARAQPQLADPRGPSGR